MAVDRPEGFRLDVSVSIAPSETVALLGPNGAGKTTSLLALAGLIPIDSGRVELGGRVLDDPAAGVFVAAEERRVGVVFQEYLLFPHLSVVENVAFGLRSRGVPHGEALDRSVAWLSRLGIGGLERRTPGDISGGQAQRVALARALAIEPELLLLDEPLSALDVSTRAELRHALGDHLASFDGPRLLITHDPTDAFLLADRIQIIEEGQITQTGTADEITLRPATSYAADLAGANLLSGVAKDGEVWVGEHALTVADLVPDGPVLVTIHPTAVSVHTHRPGGSPRNTWETTVDRVERLGARARLSTAGPLPLTAELTEEAREELAVGVGSVIWVAVKATEIGIRSDSASDGGDPAI